MRKLTHKQKVFSIGMAKGLTQTKAALEAYPGVSRETAGLIGSKNMKKENIQIYIKNLLHKAGLSDDEMIGDLKNVIKAGTTEKALKKTSSETALKALKMGFELSGAFAPKKTQVDQRTATVNLGINLEGKSDEELKDVLNDLMEETRRFKEILIKSKKFEGE